MRSAAVRACLLAVILGVAPSCAPSSDPPTSPSPAGGTPDDGHGGTGTTPPPNTVTIRSTGMSPLTLTIAVGSRVTFVNADARPHDIAGGADPARPECPELDAVGFVVSGQSRQSAVFTTARTCRYHDHTYVGVAEFTGTIVIE